MVELVRLLSRHEKIGIGQSWQEYYATQFVELMGF